MDLAKWGAPATRDLWEAFDGLRGDMDRALDFFSLPDAAGLLDKTTAPAVDIVETEEEYLVLVDLPGVDKRDLEVSVTGSLLAIKGVKKAEGNSGKRKVFRKETWVGSFSRTIDLPAEIDPGKIKAELKDGVLALRIAKREEAKTKLIAVNVQ